jgi:hypothetical protein
LNPRLIAAISELILRASQIDIVVKSMRFGKYQDRALRQAEATPKVLIGFQPPLFTGE